MRNDAVCCTELSCGARALKSDCANFRLLMQCAGQHLMEAYHENGFALFLVFNQPTP